MTSRMDLGAEWKKAAKCELLQQCTACTFTVDMKPVDMKPVDMKPVDMKPVDMKPVDMKQVDTHTHTTHQFW